jgi:CubicO group peptidase (beta-lactamase class C family)
METRLMTRRGGAPVSFTTLLALGLLLPIVSPLPGDGSDSLRQHPAVAEATTLLDVWIGEQLTYNRIPGLSIGIVYDQELIWSKGYGFSDLETKTPATPKTLYRIGSVSKLFTSTAVMQLRDQGKLRLDEPISGYLPWFSLRDASPDAPPITVRHLLTHTAGLPREGAFPYWTTHDFPTREELIAAVPTQSAVFAPAVTYKYSNLGMALLGEIVTAVSNEEYSEYVRKHIFLPLEMTDSAVYPSEDLQKRMATPYMLQMPDGRRNIHDYYSTRSMAASADVISSVKDLARFAALQLHDSSEAPIDRVLRASTAREMQRPHWVYSSWTGGRGLGFGISRRDGKTTVSHGGWIGGNRAHFLLVPSEKIAVIAMTNADDARPHSFTYQAYDVVGPAIAQATAPEVQARELDPAWKSLLGVYTDPWGWKEEVMILDGQLILYSYSYPPDEDADSGITPLTHVEGTTFRRPDGEHVVFELGEDGTVERLKKRYEYFYPVDR